MWNSVATVQLRMWILPSQLVLFLKKNIFKRWSPEHGKPCNELNISL